MQNFMKYFNTWLMTHCFLQLLFFAHVSLPWSNDWVALSFLFVVRPAMVTTTKYPLVSIYRHKNPMLTQYHLIPSSAKLYWPSATKYQPVPPPTDPLPPSTNRYRFLLTQCHHISTSTASLWPSRTKYQPVPTYTVFLGDYRLLHSLTRFLFLYFLSSQKCSSHFWNTTEEGAIAPKVLVILQ